MEYAKNKGLNMWTMDEEEKQRHTRTIQWDKFNADKIIKSFKGKPANVIVEHVMNGSTYRVQLPDHQMVVLNLTGVVSPTIRYEENVESATPGERVQVAQPFAVEAVQFVETRLLHRDVFVLFEGVDKVCIPYR